MSHRATATDVTDRAARSGATVATEETTTTRAAATASVRGGGGGRPRGALVQPPVTTIP